MMGPSTAISRTPTRALAASTDAPCRRGWLRRHPVLLTLGALAAIVGAASMYVYREIHPSLSKVYTQVDFSERAHRAASHRRPGRDRLPHRPDAVDGELRGRGEALRPVGEPRHGHDQRHRRRHRRQRRPIRRRAGSARSSSTSSSCTPTTTCATPAHPRRTTSSRTSTRSATSPSRSFTGLPAQGRGRQGVPLHDRGPLTVKKTSTAPGHVGRRRGRSPTASSPRRPPPR